MDQIKVGKKMITPKRPKWQGTMTDRERFNRQMHYQSVDRCFNMEFGYWKENFSEWDLFTDNNICSNEEADAFFNFDRISGVGANVWMDPPFPEKEIGREGSKIIMQNSDGLTAEVPADWHDTIPHYIKSSVVTPEDWKRVKEERFQRGAFRLPNIKRPVNSSTMIISPSFTT